MILDGFERYRISPRLWGRSAAQRRRCRSIGEPGVNHHAEGLLPLIGAEKGEVEGPGSHGCRLLTGVGGTQGEGKGLAQFSMRAKLPENGRLLRQRWDRRMREPGDHLPKRQGGPLGFLEHQRKRVQIAWSALYRPCDDTEVCDLPGNGATRPGHVDLTLCTPDDDQSCRERQEHTRQDPGSPHHVCLESLLGERQERRGNVATERRHGAAHCCGQGLVLGRSS